MERFGNPRGMKLQDLLLSLRPHHWIKNSFIFLPILFAREFLVPSILINGLVAVGAFCLASSGIYLINDVLDRTADLEHPHKRLRPIAAGRVEPPSALALGAGFLTAGLWVGFMAHVWVGVVLMSYVFLQTAYSFFLKKLVIIDVLAVATGFLQRVIAGVVVSGVAPSAWILLTTFLLALFIGFSKRRAELAVLGGAAGARRAVLTRYTAAFLDQVLAMLAGTVILCYSLYTVSDSTIRHLGSPVLLITVPFVVYGVLRYLYLMSGQASAQMDSPTDLLLTDRPLWWCVVLWGLLCFAIIYGGDLLKEI